MIIVNISGGLGNQMFQYAAGKSLAITNHDVLQLHILNNNPESLRKYELNQFNIEEIVASEYHAKWLKGERGIFSKIINKLRMKSFVYNTYYIDPLQNKTAKNISQVFDANVLTLKGDQYLDGYFQDERYFINIRQLLLKEYTLKTIQSENARKYNSNIQRCKNSISVHLRRGDYIDRTNYPNSGLATTDLQYYNDAYKYFQRKSKQNNYFIFSDDIEWCKNNLQFIDNKTFIESTTGIEDLMLMKSCTHNITANSSFSWWGAWLNENPEKIITTPKVWYSTNINIHIAPIDWMRI